MSRCKEYLPGFQEITPEPQLCFFQHRHLTSYQVIDLRLSPEAWLAPDGEPLREQHTYRRIRIRHITKMNRSMGAGFNTGGDLPRGQALPAQVALLHDSLCPRRKVWVDFLQEGSWIDPVEAPGTIRTRCDAIAAPDAAMRIHHHNAVLALPRCLRRTHSDTGRIVTMVTKQEHRLFSQVAFEVRAGL